jgi:tRNA A58 N-methylase Trm61
MSWKSYFIASYDKVCSTNITIVVKNSYKQYTHITTVLGFPYTVVGFPIFDTLKYIEARSQIIDLNDSVYVHNI